MIDDDKKHTAMSAPEKGGLESRVDSGATLADTLNRLTGEPGEWQGIAYTTAGARSLRSASSSALTTRVDGAEHHVPLATVYELRLWATGQKALTGAVARELRWLNGSGWAEVAVHRGTGRSTDVEDCWFRRNTYVQHSDKKDLSSTPTLESIEVFTREPVYGNVVFADELMTGKWG